MLFAGTEAGTIRSYKFPLTGDYTEIQVHAAPVTRLRITADDAFLFSVAEDATVYTFDVRDKEGRSAKRDKEMMAFAEEILVTKTDLEEKTQTMTELKTKVEELTMQNEYQLRLQDLNYSEKIKEATEKFNQELDADKKTYELLLQAKNDMEMEYEEKIKQLEERHQQQLIALEAQYQQKIMTEVERYQQLISERRPNRMRNGRASSRWRRRTTIRRSRADGGLRGAAAGGGFHPRARARREGGPDRRV